MLGVGELSLALASEDDVLVPMTDVVEGGRVDLPIDDGLFFKIVGDLTVPLELVELECSFDENEANLETEVEFVSRLFFGDVEVVKELGEIFKIEDVITGAVREALIDRFRCVVFVKLDNREEFPVLDGVDDPSLVKVGLVGISELILEGDEVAK